MITIRPGPARGHTDLGWLDSRDGVSLWWKLEGRNKRCVTLDLKSADGRRAMLGLCDGAHVLVENFRPGTLERLGLGPDVLLARNPRLVITRITGFGHPFTICFHDDQVMVVDPNESVEVRVSAFELPRLHLKHIGIQLVDQLLALISELIFRQIRTNQREGGNFRERLDIVTFQIKEPER